TETASDRPATLATIAARMTLLRDAMDSSLVLWLRPGSEWTRRARLAPDCPQSQSFRLPTTASQIISSRPDGCNSSHALVKTVVRAASPAGLLTHPNTAAAPGQQAGIFAQNRFVSTLFVRHHRGIVLEVSSERPMTV